MEHFGRREEERWHGLVVAGGLAVGFATTTLYVSAILAATAHVCGLIAPGRSAWSGSFVSTVGLVHACIAAALILRRAARGRSCGHAQALALGAEPLDDPRHPAYEATENLAATAGMPTPTLWKLNDDAINAFALGADPSDSVIVLTRGAMESLTQPQLHALIAHGSARIADGDARRDTQLVCALSPLLAPAVACRASRDRLRTSRWWSRGPWAVAYGLLRLIGAPGYTVARLTKVALARLRPDCSDVHSVMLSGDASALDGALEAIANSEEQSRSNLSVSRAVEIDHALFGPQLDVTFGMTLQMHLDAGARRQRLGLVRGQVQRQRSYAESNLTPIAVHCGEAFAHLFDFSLEHAFRARQALEAIPELIRAALRDPLGCHAVACGVLTAGRAARLANQRAHFVRDGWPDAVLEARRLQGQLSALDRACWIALTDLAVPTLRRMTDKQRDTLRADLERLATGHADALEFFVIQLWLANIDRVSSAPRGIFATGTALVPNTNAAANAIVLAFAHLGNPDDTVARRAFGDGARMAKVPAGARVFGRPDESLPSTLAAAMHTFTESRVSAQRALVLAAIHATAGDARLEPLQLEAIRAFAKALGCVAPMQLELNRAEAVADEAEQGGERAQPGSDPLAALWTDELDALITLTAGVGQP